MTKLVALGSEARGVWTRKQALKVTTPGRVRGLLAAGIWQSPLPGIYADGGSRLTPCQRAVAVTLGHKGSVACGRTAARWWQLPLIDDDDPATGARECSIDDIASTSTRTVKGAAAPKLPLAWQATCIEAQVRVVHHHRLVIPEADTVDIGGAKVLSLRRTLADCARLLTHEALVCALDDALHRELLTVEDLGHLVDRRRGRPGGVELARAVSLADGRAESPLETLGRLILLPVLPGLVPQVKVFDRAVNLVARLDLADEVRRFGVEADGKAAHSKPKQVTRDARRSDRVSAQGWGPLSRYGWWEARCTPDQLRERILREFARHARPA